MPNERTINPLPTRDEKNRALKKSLDALYAVRASITTEILAKHAVRKLNMTRRAMITFIYELNPEERDQLGMPPMTHGHRGTKWYRPDGTPNRSEAVCAE